MNAIIFDLDGTLWDVTESTLKSANEIAKKHGLQEISVEAICKGFGTNREESSKLYFPNLPLEESTQLIDEISTLNINNLMQNGGKVYVNAKETLIELKEKFDLYIVSNTAKKTYIEAFLKCSKTADLFNGYIAAGYQNLKKHEAIIKTIADNNIEKAVYVGDTYRDRDAAKLAGVTFVQAKYGFGEDLNTEYSIDNIVDLPKIIGKKPLF